jgi:hypothetical protein
MLLEQSLQHFYLLPVVFGEERLQTLDLLSGLVGVGKLDKKSLFGLGLYGIRPHVSRIRPVYDVMDVHLHPVWGGRSRMSRGYN